VEDPVSDDRILWLDLARIVSVIAIVMLHVTLVAYAPYAADSAQRDAWLAAIDETWPFHLTTLFVISGMLSSDRIRSGFGAGAGRVVLRPLYLYVVWYAIYVLLTSAGDNTWTPVLWQKKSVLIELVLPKNVLWFLLALAVWSTVFALIRKLPAWLVLSITLCVSVLTWWLPGIRGVDQYVNVLTYGFFLAVGVYGRNSIITCVMRHPAWTVAASVVVFGVSRLVVRDFWTLPAGALVYPVYLISAALVLLTASSLLVKIPILRRSAIWSGPRALPLYVLHLPIAGALVLLPWWGDIIAWISARTPIFPAVLGAVVICIALGIYAVAIRTPARVLFDPPNIIVRDRRRSSTAAVDRGDLPTG